MVQQMYPASSAAIKNTVPSAALIRNSRLMVWMALAMPSCTLGGPSAPTVYTGFLAQTTLQILARRFDVRVHQRSRFLRLAQAPRFEQRRVFARRALGAPFGAQMSLHISLGERMQAAQDLSSHRLQTRHNEQ